MALKTQIQDDMKSAMRSKDAATLSTIRLLLAAIKQVEIDERKELSEEDILGIITKMVKQRKDSISIYEQAERQNMADKEAAEIVVLNQYLPQPLSEDEIEALIKQAINDTSAQSIKDMGKVMNFLRPKLTGRADMGDVSHRIKQALNQA
mgnify:CR=1 FL=1